MLITDSPVFPSDFARECKTSIEIGISFDEMCDNFLLFIIHERTIAWKPTIFISNLTAQQEKA